LIERIVCVYCGTKNVVGSKITGPKNKINLKIYEWEGSTTVSSKQLEIDCALCEKKYVCIYGAYPEFLSNHVNYTDVALGDIKRIFPRLRSLNTILKNTTGIAKLTKRAQKLRSKDYDICFKLSKKRAYLHCKKKKTLFVVVSVHEV